VGEPGVYDGETIVPRGSGSSESLVHKCHIH
jgi:hypothetical protein